MDYTPVKEISIKLFRESMPEKVYGLVSENGKNRFFIVVNADLSEDEQAKAFLHECLHIYNDDFNSNQDVNTIEARTHAQLDRLLALKEE